MASPDAIEKIRNHISQSLAEHLLNSSIDWTALQRLDKPVLKIEAYLQDGSKDQASGPSRGVTVSHLVDLSGIATPSVASPAPSVPQRHEEKSQPSHWATGTGGAMALMQDSSHLKPPRAQPEHEPTVGVATQNYDADFDDGTGENSSLSRQRKEISELRPARSDAADVEAEPASQRQIHSEDKFPKRRKQKPVGHFLQPSTLDKLVGGIWEQIHGTLNLDPHSLLNQLQVNAPTQDTISSMSLAPLGSSQTANGVLDKTVSHQDGSFGCSNIFCRQVTQASRACRSLEVIVQARWIEQFDAYVDGWAATNPTVSRTRYNKAAVMEACADFGWSEKELRNKMYVWRGYKDIKDTGGWAALVFAGTGIYRFCKYRIGFDKDSMQRLRNLRPVIEVAADTLHPHWRQLLTVVGEPSHRLFEGHPHDYVVFLDGSDPLPLRMTYLQWDPNFKYRQIEESIVDEKEWGCDDPRWTPPSDTVAGPSSMPICETCGKEQSDDPKINNCFCFPTLFGAAKVNPSPVLVFRTPNGRNNGLVALCPFERGSPVGEFVGVVTKGLQDVDVMESSTASTNYQIWQGRQGNFTRFVNHSCKANAQYQRFTWLNTQRVILVSKGIDAGVEITVDYSNKYWKGLEKKCLCGESCCRYRRNGDDVGR